MYKDEIYARGQSIQIQSTAIKPRLDSIDILRGIVMILMALNHVRDFFTNVRFDPLDLSQTNAPLFFTRWITHFCAPVFVFLAGTGAFLSSTRGKTKPEISIFGIVMIAIHNLFDGVTPGQVGIFEWLWQVLHYGGGINFSEGYVFFAAYPLIPWIGVMAAGFGFG